MMAIAVDEATKVITVDQSDLTLVSGTLYELDTDAFRLSVGNLMDDERFIWMDDPFRHNTEVTVAGTTYARTIECINGYSIEFTPNSQWTARLAGSNNNIFDVENSVLVQNQVQVIPTNSAGLIVRSIGSGLSSSEQQQLSEIHTRLDLESGNPNTYADDGSTISNTDFTLTKSDNGNGTFDVDRS